MTIQRMIELLEAEHQCMLRNSHGDCDRKCEDCDLVQDDSELHEMYTDVIFALKEYEAKSVITHENAYGRKFYYCPKCGREFYDYPPYPVCCDRCGQAVKWDD